MSELSRWRGSERYGTCDADHGWSASVSNLSNKLQRQSLRYVEARQLAEALGFELVWQKRRDA